MYVVIIFKKTHRRKREKLYCQFCFLCSCWRHKNRKTLMFFLWPRADYLSFRHQRVWSGKTIGSHLKCNAVFFLVFFSGTVFKITWENRWRRLLYWIGKMTDSTPLLKAVTWSDIQVNMWSIIQYWTAEKGISGGIVAEWLGRWTWNPEVAGSSPALTTKLQLFLDRPEFNFSVMLVNSQLVCLTPVWIFNQVMLICIICFIIWFHWPWKTPLGEWWIAMFIFIILFV